MENKKQKSEYTLDGRKVTPKKVFIGMPTYSMLFVPFVQSLQESFKVVYKEGGHTILPRFRVGESLIPRGRNDLVVEFLATDCTHLLFLDTDLSWHPQTLIRLLSWDEDIVCGVYPAKQLKVRYILNEKYYEREDGLISVREAGTGAMLIKRDVFKAMRTHGDQEAADGWFAHMGADGRDKLKFGYDYFRTGVYNTGKAHNEIHTWRKSELPEEFKHMEGEPKTNYLSEDWYFCQRWRQIGGEVFVDPKCTFSHHGQMEYPVRYNELTDAISWLEGEAKRSGVSIDEL